MSLGTLVIVTGIVAVTFGLVIAGMAVGVIFSDRRIKGSCGGLANMRDGDGTSPCMACGDKSADCDEVKRTACASPAATASTTDSR